MSSDHHVHLRLLMVTDAGVDFISSFTLFRVCVRWSQPFLDNVMQGAWYGNVVYLGKEQDIPVVTMT